MKKHHFTLRAVRRLIFFLMIMISYALQFIILPATALPFPLLLLIPVTVAITMHENEPAGLLWGLLTGALWDIASPLTDGLYALILPVIFLMTGLLTRYILRNTLLTAVMFTAVFSAIPSLLGMLYTKEALTGTLAGQIALTQLLPAIITSVLIIVPVYYLIGSADRRFTCERV